MGISYIYHWISVIFPLFFNRTALITILTGILTLYSYISNTSKPFWGIQIGIYNFPFYHKFHKFHFYWSNAIRTILFHQFYFYPVASQGSNTHFSLTFIFLYIYLIFTYFYGLKYHWDNAYQTLRAVSHQRSESSLFTIFSIFSVFSIFVVYSVFFNIFNICSIFSIFPPHCTISHFSLTSHVYHFMYLSFCGLCVFTVDLFVLPYLYFHNNNTSHLLYIVLPCHFYNCYINCFSYIYILLHWLFIILIIHFIYHKYSSILLITTLIHFIYVHNSQDFSFALQPLY